MYWSGHGVPGDQKKPNLVGHESWALWVQVCGYKGQGAYASLMDLEFKGVGGPHPIKAVIRQALRDFMPVELTIEDHIFHLMDLDFALWG